MAEPALNDPPMSMDEVKESITAKGRERGFVTSEDLLEAVPVDDLTPEQVEEFLTQIQEHLTAEAIEVIEVPGEDSDPATNVRIEVDLLKAPTNDPVRMYLKEIGKVPLLNAAQEVDLARRIEAGELSTALQQHFEDEPKADPKALKLVVEKVWEIRDHQQTAFGKVEGIGREKIAKSYRPKTEPEMDDWLRRVERDGQLAKKKLIEANLRLVVSIAKRYVGPRDAVPGPDPGGQPGPDPRGGEVRPLEGVQVLDVRHVVDPPGHHARDRRPGADDPDPRAHGRDDQQARPRAAAAVAGPRPRAHARRDRQGHGHQRREGARDPEGVAGAGVARDPDRRGGRLPPRRLHRGLRRRRPGGRGVVHPAAGAAWSRSCTR